MIRFICNCLVSGVVSGALSHAAAAAASARAHGRSDLPMHAVSHIAWNDHPASHRGDAPVDAVIGTSLHYGSSIFWAGFFEALFGRRAERSTAGAVAGGAAIATAAYITDYHVVSDRFKPGFEAYLSPPALFTVYVALALGLAASARLRGLCNHQVENEQEGDKRGHAQRGPDVVVSPE